MGLGVGVGPGVLPLVIGTLSASSGSNWVMNWRSLKVWPEAGRHWPHTNMAACGQAGRQGVQGRGWAEEGGGPKDAQSVLMQDPPGLISVASSAMRPVFATHSTGLLWAPSG